MATLLEADGLRQVPRNRWWKQWFLCDYSSPRSYVLLELQRF